MVYTPGKAHELPPRKGEVYYEGEDPYVTFFTTTKTEDHTDHQVEEPAVVHEPVDQSYEEPVVVHEPVIVHEPVD
jgi:hypothetical protein